MTTGGEFMKLTGGAILVLAAPFACGVLLAHGAMAVAEGGGAPARASGAGGLSLTPQIVEHRARVGAVGTAVIVNTTAKPVRITVRARSWTQSRGGMVSPDVHRSLGRQVAVTPSSFTLAAGARRQIALRLKRHPAGGSLYGALDVMGVPRGAVPVNGIIPRYRLIGSLRLDPAKPRMSVRAGRLKVTGRRGRHALVLPLRNRGNTVEPIAGAVILSGAHGIRPNRLRPLRIVPRRTVDLTLGTYRGLLRGQPRGRYSIAVRLVQAGRVVVHTTRRVTLR
jgi:hypothetical protein